jgi:signal transduction histidine kinase
MLTVVQGFRARMQERIREFTYRWWTDRHEDNQNFFYHVDDKFYEQTLRQEAEELLDIVFSSFFGPAREKMLQWARETSAKRAVQDVPPEEAIERFRMFRRVLQQFFKEYATEQNLDLMLSLQVAEEMTHNVELAMQNWMACYMELKNSYLNEQKKRFDVERLASIGQMAAGVAHEVRNPLTATRGFLQLLAEVQPHAFLNIAMEELDRGIDTISSMLDVAKPPVPDAPKSPLLMAPLLKHTVDLFHDKQYKKRVVYEFQDEECTVWGRRETLKQAFFNVIKNALEAMKDLEDPVLTLRHFRRGRTLVIEVQDNGMGIPAGKLHLLGTPFFSMKDAGNGLGLTMVYRTMHEHFAHVTVESDEGQGVLFRFEFPMEGPLQVL